MTLGFPREREGLTHRHQSSRDENVAIRRRVYRPAQPVNRHSAASVSGKRPPTDEQADRTARRVREDDRPRPLNFKDGGGTLVRQRHRA
jgi:hypothetical protein